MAAIHMDHEDDQFAFVANRYEIDKQLAIKKNIALGFKHRRELSQSIFQIITFMSDIQRKNKMEEAARNRVILPRIAVQAGGDGAGEASQMGGAEAARETTDAFDAASYEAEDTADDGLDLPMLSRSPSVEPTTPVDTTDVSTEIDRVAEEYHELQRQVAQVATTTQEPRQTLPVNLDLATIVKLVEPDLSLRDSIALHAALTGKKGSTKSGTENGNACEQLDDLARMFKFESGEFPVAVALWHTVEKVTFLLSFCRDLKSNENQYIDEVVHKLLGSDDWSADMDFLLVRVADVCFESVQQLLVKLKTAIANLRDFSEDALYANQPLHGPNAVEYFKAHCSLLAEGEHKSVNDAVTEIFRIIEKVAVRSGAFMDNTGDHLGLAVLMRDVYFMCTYKCIDDCITDYKVVESMREFAGYVDSAIQFLDRHNGRTPATTIDFGQVAVSIIVVPPPKVFLAGGRRHLATLTELASVYYEGMNPTTHGRKALRRQIRQYSHDFSCPEVAHHKYYPELTLALYLAGMRTGDARHTRSAQILLGTNAPISMLSAKIFDLLKINLRDDATGAILDEQGGGIGMDILDVHYTSYSTYLKDSIGWELPEMALFPEVKVRFEKWIKKRLDDMVKAVIEDRRGWNGKWVEYEDDLAPEKGTLTSL